MTVPVATEPPPCSAAQSGHQTGAGGAASADTGPAPGPDGPERGGPRRRAPAGRAPEPEPEPVGRGPTAAAEAGDRDRVEPAAPLVRRRATTTAATPAASTHTTPPADTPARGPNASDSRPISGAPSGVPPMKHIR